MLSASKPPPATTAPAQPTYILRGHAAQIHSVHFYSSNTRLATADASGWVILWSLLTRRATAVWKAHEGSVLKVDDWDGKIVTHGRDNKLFVWRVEEEGMDVLLPVEDEVRWRRRPWLVASLDVNALNFCGFGGCAGAVAAAAAAAAGVDVMRLPDGARVYAGVRHGGVKTGMAMALSMFYSGENLVLVAGYESGHAVVYKWDTKDTWNVVYTHKPHSQPILSLSISPTPGTNPYFITSSADSVVAKHPLPIPTATPASNTPDIPPPNEPIKIMDTRHYGQQSITIRSDGRIFSTAGWDSRIRIYSVKTMKELAVLKWHREGCYAVAFGEILDGGGGGEVLSVGKRREKKVKETHWVAGGAKDGKVSLWEIY
ncbi:WD40 repeat-like protein [Tuber magnatum]|uniref:ASTRA-associated protein 1 n=1 Tax=Tuber magnatum TaxID=42249 RepID=A0A317SYL3_9PEZI|nr:WD40 repeat-like protein [Tuber magnatum]